MKKETASPRHRARRWGLEDYRRNFLEEDLTEGTLDGDKPALDVAASRLAHVIQFSPQRMAVSAAMAGMFDYTQETRPFLTEYLTGLAREHETALYRPGDVPVNG